jgi:peptidyl-prolyl cis-trans isomerase D
MLNFIRERAQGWVAWFIVGLISIPFALWGVNSYLNGPTDVVTATVNGEKIKQADVQQALQQYRERMRDSMGDTFDPAMFEGDAIKQIVVEGLIEQKLLQQANVEIGQEVSDSVINRLIQSTPAFQTDGQFDPERYRLILARIGESPLSYEAQLKADVLAQELTSNIQKSGLVTEAEQNAVIRLEKQSRDIAYGVISAQSMLANVEILDEDVKAYFDANKALYVAPERVAINYIELSIDDLAKSVEVNDDNLKQYYVDNEAQFVGPEQRRASHILIEGDDNEALDVLNTIKGKLDAGESFEVLAKEYSSDTGSADSGGDLGYFQRDVMEPAFEDAAFALSNIGDVSEPVKTEFGYHLIKLTDIKSDEGATFADVKEQVELQYRKQNAEEMFYDYAEQLADLSYENPDNLDAAAEVLSLPIQQTEAFTRNGGSGIASNKKVVSVAFSEDVLTNDLNSAVIEVSKTDLVVIHKREYIASSVLPFESVAPAITEQLRFNKARDLAKTTGEDKLAQLQSGKEALALFESDEWHDKQTYTRASQDVSAQVLQNAFSLAIPSEGASNWSGFSAENGNYIVLNISDVTDAEPSVATDEERAGLQSYLKQTYSSSELQAFIESLKSDADIKIN